MFSPGSWQYLQSRPYYQVRVLYADGIWTVRHVFYSKQKALDVRLDYRRRGYLAEVREVVPKR